MVLRADPPQHLHPGECVEATVEPSAVGNRIDVAANEQFLFTIAPQGGPKIPRRIVMHLDRKPLKTFAQKIPRRHPHRRERHPLCAVRIAGQRTQLLKFINCSFRGKRIAHAANVQGKSLPNH